MNFISKDEGNAFLHFKPALLSKLRLKKPAFLRICLNYEGVDAGSQCCIFCICPPGLVFLQTRKITLETSASVRLAWSLPNGLATVWLHKPPSVGKQTKKLGLFFLETGPAPGHVQNMPVVTLHLGKSRNGDRFSERWNSRIFLGIMRNEVAKESFLQVLNFICRFAIVALPAGQESTSQPKLGCGKVVLFSCFTFSPKPVVVMKHNTIK